MGLVGEYFYLMIAMSALAFCLFIKASYGADIWCEWELCIKTYDSEKETCIAKQGYKQDMIEDWSKAVSQRFMIKVDCKKMDSKNINAPKKNPADK